ncbi:MAG: quinone-dependent dihydroorotate dehydrogenase [Granulosicoccaceae bacterium]
MLYPLLRPALFSLDAERSHDLALSLLGKPGVPALVQVLYGRRAASKPVKLLGLEFDNPVGLAAGLDKNAKALDGLGACGFGFVEVGTVTPKPQPGNEKPRLFRLPEAQAIINRFGFNNEGVDALVERVRQRNWRGVVGINIGKNASTAAADATEDYLIGLRAVYAVADYITVNISSPNTKGLRDLQHGAQLEELFAALSTERDALATAQARRVPLLVKIAPDMSDEAMTDLCHAVLRHRIDGVIATNTTLGREGVEGLPHGNESGGLSGAPLTPLAASKIKPLRHDLGADIALIAAGGINSPLEAEQRLADGADLIQLYSSLIYQGPTLVQQICRHLASA